MIIESELRSEIARAIRGEVSLGDLYRWLMARSWNMHKDSEDGAVELAASVESLFFARSSGDISEEALRHDLSSLAKDMIAQEWEVTDHIRIVVRNHGFMPSRKAWPTESAAVLVTELPRATRAASSRWQQPPAVTPA
jgi:hypothetical protein